MPTRKLANPLWAFAFPTIGAALTIIAAVVAAAAARRLHRHHRRGLCRSRSPAGTFTLGYWDIRGLAAPARMMLAYRGAAFEDRTYSLQPQEGGGWGAPAWFDTDRPPLRERNAFINLPYLVDHESGIVVSQSTALYQFLGRKLGLMGENEAERAATEQTLAQVPPPTTALPAKASKPGGVREEERVVAPSGEPAPRPCRAQTQQARAQQARAQQPPRRCAPLPYQAFDLRNECVRVVYPFAGTSAERFSAALAKHLRAVAAPSAAYDRFSRFLGDKPFFAGALSSSAGGRGGVRAVPFLTRFCYLQAHGRRRETSISGRCWTSTS